MKEDEKARLVFSTATHIEGCEMIEGFDGGLGSEARQERNEQISLLNKSIRKSIKERTRTRELQTRQDVSTVVGLIWQRPRRAEELYSLLYNTTIKDKVKYARVTNILQIIRVGSNSAIFAKDRIWQLAENYPSSMITLVNKIMDNKHLVWQKKSIRKTQEKPVNKENIRAAQEPEKLNGFIKKPIQKPQQITKKLTIDSPVGEITINLNIKITVEGV